MIKYCFAIVCLISCFTGHSQGNSHLSSINRLNCILLGYDSLAWYYGCSDNMQDLRSGKMSDSNFMKTFIGNAKDHSKDQPLNIALKPTASGNVTQDLNYLICALNANAFGDRFLDTLDAKERVTFNTRSMQEALKQSIDASYKTTGMQGLPAIGSGGMAVSVAAPVKPVSKKLSILIFNKDSIYAFMGSDISTGRRYTCQEMRKYVQQCKTEGNLFVLIKASAKYTYDNMVNMLDELAREGITRYSVQDLSKDEEKYCKQLPPMTH